MVQAGVVVERLFPPDSARSALCILAALNLLNASVKQPWGARMVTYAYIKGMASCMFVRQLYLPLPGIGIYLDLTDSVAYFRVMGVQLSFHHIPIYRELLHRLENACDQSQRQTWDGMRLQQIAVEVFRMACPWKTDYSAEVEAEVRHRLLRFHKPSANCLFGFPRQWPFDGHTGPPAKVMFTQLPKHVSTPVRNTPFGEDKAASLKAALQFNIWHSDCFMLFRRRDRQLIPVVRYTGNNYQQLMAILTQGNQRIRKRKEKTLVPGKLYRLSPQKMVKSISPSRHLLSLTQNNYLREGNLYQNLCVTHGIAIHLATLFPGLRFVNTLNYNRLNVRHRYYRLADLCRVPLGSKARCLKVWIPADQDNLLTDFDVGSLPQELVEEYLTAEDYYQEFEVVTGSNGLQGLYAYRRHHILPTIYPCIQVINYHARVMNEKHKWAIYALNQERFKTGFIYDKIWYDPERAAIMGLTKGREKVVAQLRLKPKST